MCERHAKTIIDNCFTVKHDPEAPPVEPPRFIKAAPVKAQPYAADIRKILAENSVKGE